MNFKRNELTTWVKAIVVANVFNLLAVFAWTMTLSLVVISISGGGANIHSNPPVALVLLSSCGGTIINVLSGYICAKISKGTSYFVILLFQISNMLVSWPIGNSSSFSLVEVLMSGFLGLPFTFFGAWLFVRKKRTISDAIA
jgi:hypothetical protein